MRYLLDTNVLSEIRKKQANALVTRWFDSVSLKQCYICVITLGEIRRGIEKRRLKDAPYAEILEEWLLILEHQYKDRILVLDKLAADEWGRITSAQSRNLIDAQIAAIALANDAILVTSNVKDFKELGVKLYNPFEIA